MEPTEENLNTLVNVLQASYGNDKKLRDEATEYLMNNSGTPGLTSLLMVLISSDSLDNQVRTSAAANLYSLIQRSWNPENSPYPGIPDQDKEQMKGSIVELMLSVPSFLFKPVSGALQTISSHEFPHNWPALMPDLCIRLQSDDPDVVIGILKTMNSVLKFYRNKPDTAGYVSDLLKILEVFGDPMRQLFELYTQQFDANLGNEDVVVVLLTTIRLLWEIFYSLTSIDIPQVFVDHLPFWMEQLKKYLTFTSEYPKLLPDPDDDTSARPGLLSKLHTSLLRILALFAKKYDEDFEPYITSFLSDVWSLLERVGGLPETVQIHYDGLVIEALSFLTISITGVHHKMFQEAGILESICNNVVVPNIRFTQKNLETFEYEPLEYIRSDFEGSDYYTRRRSVIELVKGIRRYYETEVTKIFSDLINQLLSEYSTNPDEKWFLKDQAIYLVIALTATSQTRVKGVVAINELVPLIDFFDANILPELEDLSQFEARQVVKADCIRFAISFRRQLASHHWSKLIELFAAYLTNPSTVVASYSAMALDAFLSIKDGPKLRLPLEVVEPHIPTLFTNLFNRVNAENAGKFESENPYIGLAIARLISFAGPAVIPVAQTCLDQLTNKLAAIYKNPTNAKFVHCLFEGIAGIIGALIEANRPELCESVEEQLLPAFTVILDEDIIDLAPYVFQIMAQLIEARKSDPVKLLERYGASYEQFTISTHWERFGNIPALTRLLSAYIRFVPHFIADKLIPVLGIFKRVNELKTYEKHSFRLIQDILLYIDRAAWNQHLPTIFDLMFSRLRNAKTANYVNLFVVFISNLCYAPQLGPPFVVEAMNSVQAGILNPILTDVIIPNLTKTHEFRSASVGMTCLLTSSIMYQEYKPHWVPLLTQIVNLLAGIKDASAGNTDDLVADYLALEEKGGYTSEFSQLNFSGAKNDDLIVPREINPKQFLAVKLAEMSQQIPSSVGPLCEALPAETQEPLSEMLTAAGVMIQ